MGTEGGGRGGGNWEEKGGETGVVFSQENQTTGEETKVRTQVRIVRKSAEMGNRSIEGMRNGEGRGIR